MDEFTIAQLQQRMASGELDARRIVGLYLERIESLDQRGPALNSVIELNPDALDIAGSLDQERKVSGARGPLHGIPVLLKDNLDTGDRMQTTAGSLALAGTPAAEDSFVAARLREAGAVILGKTNLSEWANFRSTHSTSGWSSRGGQTRNPYALDRNPSGSSSGSAVAVAANLCTVAVGTETDGSIISPAHANSVVGIKPTRGLVSRSGIVPIAHSQDTAGAMGRTVADAAVLLGAMTGVDPRDPATAPSRELGPRDYTRFLDPNGLRGARIGIARNFMGFSEKVDRVVESCLEAMKQAGAEIADPANVENVSQLADTEMTILLYEFKADLSEYLTRRGPTVEYHSLAELIDFNERNAKQVMPYFAQELFVMAQAKGPLTDDEYVRALEANHRLSRTEGLDATFEKHGLDAIVAPSGGPPRLTDLIAGDASDGGGSSSPAAVAGYPSITVPAGYVFGLPVGLSFIGRAFDEGRLIRLAYAFEQLTHVRHPPRFLPTASL